jgi:hypothetical protein
VLGPEPSIEGLKSGDAVLGQLALLVGGALGGGPCRDLALVSFEAGVGGVLAVALGEEGSQGFKIRGPAVFTRGPREADSFKGFDAIVVDLFLAIGDALGGDPCGKLALGFILALGRGILSVVGVDVSLESLELDIPASIISNATRKTAEAAALAFPDPALNTFESGDAILGHLALLVEGALGSDPCSKGLLFGNGHGGVLAVVVGHEILDDLKLGVPASVVGNTALKAAAAPTLALFPRPAGDGFQLTDLFLLEKPLHATELLTAHPTGQLAIGSGGGKGSFIGDELSKSRPGAGPLGLINCARHVTSPFLDSTSKTSRGRDDFLKLLHMIVVGQRKTTWTLKKKHGSRLSKKSINAIKYSKCGMKALKRRSIDKQEGL